MSTNRPLEPALVGPLRGFTSYANLPWLSPEGGAALVNPSTILGTSLKLWLYGGARITGNPVDSWGDNALICNDFAGSLTARPALASELGFSVPDFDGVNDYLASTSTFATVSGTAAWELWFVANPDTLTADPASAFQTAGITEGLGGHGVGFSTSGARAWTTTVGTTGTGFAAVSSGARCLIRGGYDGANVYVGVNGGSLVTAAKTGNVSSTTGTMRIGANYNLTTFLDCRICDVIAVNRAVTSGEAASLTAYFKARWSIP